MNKKIIIACSLFSIITNLLLTPHNQATAQISSGNLDGRINVVFSAIPFLRINPDSRSAAMGDAGIASCIDIGALYHNASQLAFTPTNTMIGTSYTPWLRELAPDIFLTHVAGFKRIDKLQTIGASLRYFALGNIQFTDYQGGSAGEGNPNEFSFELAYARRLSDRFSSGITLKYANSNLSRGQNLGGGATAKSAQAVAADVSFYYQNPEIQLFGKEAKWALGAAVTNIGNKVSYLDGAQKDFIPTNLGVGTSITTNINEFNSLQFAVDINKLLVPTPDTVGGQNVSTKSLLSGWFGSFSDAPGGGKEELQELMYSVGMEYWYNQQFAVRVGHFNEHRLKGNRKFLSFGVGLRYNIFDIGFTYLVQASNQVNPLNNTMRFSLTFNFDKSNKNDEAPQAE